MLHFIKSNVFNLFWGCNSKSQYIFFLVSWIQADQMQRKTGVRRTIISLIVVQRGELWVRGIPMYCSSRKIQNIIFACSKLNKILVEFCDAESFLYKTCFCLKVRIKIFCMYIQLLSYTKAQKVTWHHMSSFFIPHNLKMLLLFPLSI